jgi:hypothetical protein
MSSNLDMLHRLMKQENECNDCNASKQRKASYSQGANIHNPIWRQMVVEWCYQVIDHISADRELVYITMNILDRFLSVQMLKRSDTDNAAKTTSRQYLTDKKDYETAVMTALLMTMKLQGLSSLCINDLVQMSSNSVTSLDIVQVGKEIIQCLTWNKQIPTAARFAHVLVQLLPITVNEATMMNIFENAVFQIELSVQDESCSHQAPSLVAWMAFENAISATSLPCSVGASVRSLIAQEIGHVYDTCLRKRLQNFQFQSFVSSHASNIIPPDDDDDCSGVVSETQSIESFSLRARPLTESSIISLENLKNIPSLQQENEGDQGSSKRIENFSPALRRTKRARFC